MQIAGLLWLWKDIFLHWLSKNRSNLKLNFTSKMNIKIGIKIAWKKDNFLFVNFNDAQNGVYDHLFLNGYYVYT